jgi:DNA primase
MGTSLTEEQLRLISSFADTLILSLDTDEAGQKATWKDILMGRKQGLTVKVIVLEGGKDPDEVLQKYGKETLTNCVNRAILDSDFLLSSLSKKYDITTPEGKNKLALEFFQYVDVLQSDIQKESSLEQLANAFQLRLETVKTDYVNRESATKKLEGRTTTDNKPAKVNLNAELRAILAVVSNIDFFPLMRGSLSADDFEDSLAKDMFITLEECYREDIVNYDSILLKLQNENLRNIVAQAVTSGEFAQNTEKTINDSIKMIRLNSLKKRRESLMMTIRQLSMSENTLENQARLNTLLNEKMNIDTELRFIKDTSR